MQNDQYNDRRQSADYEQNMSQQGDRNEDRWQNGYGSEWRNQRGNSGSFSDRNNEWNNRNERENQNTRNERRLESMGSLGNDWVNNPDNENYSNPGNYGGRDSDNYQRRFENYEDRRPSSGYGNTGGFRNDAGNRMGSFGQSSFGQSSFGQRDNSRDWWDKTKDEVSGWFGDQNAQRRRQQDQQGEHRGKGPKGYTRTDERIKEDVYERLTEDSYIDASEIEVDVKNGEVFLKGTVKDKQEKRRTEDLIENISGVKNVENRIRVQQDSGSSGNMNAGQNESNTFGASQGAGLKTSRSGEYSTHN